MPSCSLRLEQKYMGSTLEEARITSGRYAIHGVFAGHEQLVADIRTGLVLSGVGAKGKLIIWVFENGMYLHCTLGLKGRWLARKAKHSGVCLAFNRGQAWFDDQLPLWHVEVLRQQDHDCSALSTGSRRLSDTCTTILRCIRRVIDSSTTMGYIEVPYGPDKDFRIRQLSQERCALLCQDPPAVQVRQYSPGKADELFKAVLQVPPEHTCKLCERGVERGRSYMGRK